MSAHPRGQWTKRIDKVLHYFGAWDNPQAALDEWDRFRAARDVQAVPTGALTVENLCDLFGTAKQAQYESGELSVKMLHDYRRAAQFAADVLGKTTLAAHLRPDDFARLRAKMAQRLGTHDLANQIRRIKSIFKWAWENERLDKPPRYGSSFAKPRAAAIRKATAASSKFYSPAVLRAMLAKARGPVRGFIYLGINCGFGAMDISELPAASFDLARGFVTFPRPKTGVPRQCPLWPQTVRAIAPYLRSEGRAFTTAHGNPWVRFKVHKTKDGDVEKAVRIDSVAGEFNKVRLAMKPAPPPFYALRHTFRTVADEVGDHHAIARVMGHALPGLAHVYVRSISEDRLRKVTGHVRAWLVSGRTSRAARAKAAASARSVRSSTAA